MTKIKICGLKRIEDVDYVNEFMPDYAGFVFAGKKRKIDKELASKLKEHMNPKIKVVGVFVDEPIENVTDLVISDIIDIVQLHGDEDKDYIEQLRKKVDVPIIKAVRVQSAQDIIDAKELKADYLLLDSYSSTHPGGTGLGFDKSLIPKDLDNYFLAGGLGPDNLKDSIVRYSPYAVDLSSSVETDGFKDREKIKEVIEIVRNI